MTYIVILAYSISDDIVTSNAEDFSDDGTLIGTTALGTWRISDYSTPVNGLLTRASTSYHNYNPIKLTDKFYNANKIEIDAWLIDNPTYALRFSFTGYPPTCAEIICSVTII